MPITRHLRKKILIAQKLANNYRKELWVVASDAVRALKDLSCLATMQEAIPTDLFMHTANPLAMSQASFAILFCEEVLRRNADTIEIWAPDVAAPEITVLLAQARRFKQLKDRGEFMLRIPMGEGFSYSPMPLAEEMTVKDLKALAAVCCGVLSDKLMVAHLGKELTPSGLLMEEGVVPGSCITVCKIIER